MNLEENQPPPSARALLEFSLMPETVRATGPGLRSRSDGSPLSPRPRWGKIEGPGSAPR